MLIATATAAPSIGGALRAREKKTEFLKKIPFYCVWEIVDAVSPAKIEKEREKNAKTKSDRQSVYG